MTMKNFKPNKKKMYSHFLYRVLSTSLKKGKSGNGLSIELEDTPQAHSTPQSSSSYA